MRNWNPKILASDPPEPHSDRWYEKHCPKCTHNIEWQENGKWYARCDNCGVCEFEEEENE